MNTGEENQLRIFKFPQTPTKASDTPFLKSEAPRNRSISLPGKTTAPLSPTKHASPPSRLPRRLRPPPLNLNRNSPPPLNLNRNSPPPFNLNQHFPKPSVLTPPTPTRIPIRDSMAEAGLLSPGPAVRCRPFTKPDPRLLFRHLRSLIGSSAMDIQENIGIDDLIALHEREMMEKQEKQIVKSGRSNDWGLSIFGAGLRQVSLYASTTAALGGYQHDLPIIVFSCVEELYQRGLQSAIYFNPPSTPSPRVIQFQSIFDSAPQYGLGTALEADSEDDIYSLLLSFFVRLPEPIVGATHAIEGMKQIIWDWCILTTTGRRRLQYNQTPGGSNVVYISNETDETLCKQSMLSAVVSSYSSEDEESEWPQTSIIQHLLRLLPSANLSVFFYLLGFVHQIVVGLQKGGLLDKATIDGEREELGRTFGKWIFGKRIRDSWGVEAQEDASTIMMVWFLTRWERISSGLFSMGKGRGPPSGSRAHSPLQSPNPPTTPIPPQPSGPSLRSESFPEVKKSANKGTDLLDQLLEMLKDGDVDVGSSPEKPPVADDGENLLSVTLPGLIEPSSASYAESETATSSSSTGYFASRIQSMRDSGFWVLENKLKRQSTRLRRSVGGETDMDRDCDSAACKRRIRSLEMRLKTALQERDEAWDIIEDIRKMMAAH